MPAKQVRDGLERAHNMNQLAFDDLGHGWYFWTGNRSQRMLPCEPAHFDAENFRAIEKLKFGTRLCLRALLTRWHKLAHTLASLGSVPTKGLLSRSVGGFGLIMTLIHFRMIVLPRTYTLYETGHNPKHSRSTAGSRACSCNLVE
jgi:hypothetical protein